MINLPTNIHSNVRFFETINHKLISLLIVFLCQGCCSPDPSMGPSANIEESKEYAMFVSEYKIIENMVDENKNQFISFDDIKEIWLEHRYYFMYSITCGKEDMKKSKGYSLNIAFHRQLQNYYTGWLARDIEENEISPTYNYMLTIYSDTIPTDTVKLYFFMIENQQETEIGYLKLLPK